MSSVKTAAGRSSREILQRFEPFSLAVWIRLLNTSPTRVRLSLMESIDPAHELVVYCPTRYKTRKSSLAISALRWEME